MWLACHQFVSRTFVLACKDLTLLSTSIASGCLPGQPGSECRKPGIQQGKEQCRSAASWCCVRGMCKCRHGDMLTGLHSLCRVDWHYAGLTCQHRRSAVRSCRLLCMSEVCHLANAGGTPYSLHNLEQGAVYEAKEFHLQQAHKPLPDKVPCSCLWQPKATQTAAFCSAGAPAQQLWCQLAVPRRSCTAHRARNSTQCTHSPICAQATCQGATRSVVYIPCKTPANCPANVCACRLAQLAPLMLRRTDRAWPTLLPCSRPSRTRGMALQQRKVGMCCCLCFDWKANHVLNLLQA